MTRGSKEFRRVRKGKNCILLVADAATTNAVLLPYRCHDQYKNDALATAPQDYRIIDTNVSALPESSGTPENRVLLHFHASNALVSLRHLDYCMISLRTTCHKTFLFKSNHGT